MIIGCLPCSFEKDSAWITSKSKVSPLVLSVNIKHYAFVNTANFSDPKLYVDTLGFSVLFSFSLVAFLLSSDSWSPSRKEQYT
jgi:hypothetical protein